MHGFDWNGLCVIDSNFNQSELKSSKRSNRALCAFLCRVRISTPRLVRNSLWLKIIIGYFGCLFFLSIALSLSASSETATAIFTSWIVLFQAKRKKTSIIVSACLCFLLIIHHLWG